MVMSRNEDTGIKSIVVASKTNMSDKSVLVYLKRYLDKAKKQIVGY